MPGASCLPSQAPARDVLETRIVLDGWEIDLVDTAGLRGADEPYVSATEQAGIERAVAAAAAADLVIHVRKAGLEPVAFPPAPSHRQSGDQRARTV